MSIRRLFVILALLNSAVGSAEIVANYHLNIEAQSTGREPAFLLSSEDGWRCRTQSELTYRERNASGAEKIQRMQLSSDASLLESPRIAGAFDRVINGRARDARLSIRETCQRGPTVAWVAWTCALPKALPEQLWQTESVECHPAGAQLPAGDAQSQLLKSLHNRTFRTSIILRDKSFAKSATQLAAKKS